MNNKILIVEDESIVALDTKHELEKIGYQVTDIALTGEDALRKIKKDMPDLVLMDIVLKGKLDGIDTATRIRKDYLLPVIYTTAYFDKKTLDRAKMAEPFGFLIKPYSSKELRSTIDMALYKSKLEKDANESREWLFTTLRSIGDAVVATDIEGAIKFINPVMEKIMGWKKQEVIGKKLEEVFKFINEDTRGEISSPIKKVLKSNSTVGLEKHTVIVSRKGKEIPISSSGSPIRNEKNEVIGVVLIFRDITKFRQAEEKERKNHQKLKNLYENLKSTQDQLIQAEKMSALGQLSAGIAHEFNNLLGIMSGYVQYARRTQSKEDMLDALNIVDTTSDRAGKIIENLMFFSAKKSWKVEYYDLPYVIDKVLTLIENQLAKQNIKIIRDYEKVPRIKLNVVDMQQVFLNLIVNARDAMQPQGGQLTIRIKKDGQYITVSFHDTGGGIKEEFRSKIFDPFFTTKGALGGSEIHGTGLGLSISYAIVKRHKGIIKVENEEAGAKFMVKLPIKSLKKTAAVEEKVKSPKKVKAKKLNILVVDDEEEICNVLSNYLRLDNHRVKTACNGKKAIGLIGKKHEYDVVFLDMLMPGMDGLEVLKTIKKDVPGTKIIVMTGALKDPGFMKKIKTAGADYCVSKPFNMDEVLQLIKKI
jgi:PAS domain S-box-containing protein